MFEIKMVVGQEIRESKGDTFTLNPNTGVLTISRVNGFEETTVHYSPAAWSTCPSAWTSNAATSLPGER